ncbi:MAG: alpha/beta hydrolase, partial [Solimonas sp.]
MNMPSAMTPNSTILAPSDSAAAGAAAPGPVEGASLAGIPAGVDKSLSLRLYDDHNIMIVIQLPERGREPDMDQDHSPMKPSPAQLALQMLTPRRQRRRGGLCIEEARRIVFACDGERVSVLQVGAGPLVLLVHGWEGAAADFATLLPALLGEGYAVALLDLPAHGDSGGTRATLPAAARALAEFGRRHGPLHGVIGHSLGAAAVGEALKLGLAAEAAVLLAP